MSDIKYLNINGTSYSLGRQTKVFYGSPTSTFTDVQQDDYLVDSSTGCTYKYNNSSWVKITDYQSAIDACNTVLTSSDDGEGNVYLYYRGVLNADIIEY